MFECERCDGGGLIIETLSLDAKVIACPRCKGSGVSEPSWFGSTFQRLVRWWKSEF